MSSGAVLMYVVFGLCFAGVDVRCILYIYYYIIIYYIISYIISYLILYYTLPFSSSVPSSLIFPSSPPPNLSSIPSFPSSLLFFPPILLFSSSDLSPHLLSQSISSSIFLFFYSFSSPSSILPILFSFSSQPFFPPQYSFYTCRYLHILIYILPAFQTI